MATVLEQNKYYAPGVAVSQLFAPRPSAATSFQRIPCYVGVGSRNLLFENRSILRGYVSDEVLTFTLDAPFQALLNFKAMGTKEDTRLITSDGEEVDSRTWSFVEESGNFIGIQITAAVYDASKTYVISYQSNDNLAKDDIGIPNIERVLALGLRVDGVDYTSEDYSIETIINPFEEGSEALAVVTNVGTGDLPQTTAGSSYLGPTRRYSLIIDDNQNLNIPDMVLIVPDGGNTGTGAPVFNIQNWSGSVDTNYALTVSDISVDGNTVTVDWTRDTPVAAGQVTFKLGFETNVAFIDGIVLDSGDLTLYAVGDLITYTVGLRPGDQMLVSWFAEDVNGGAGQVTVNDLNRADAPFTDGMNIVWGADLALYAIGDAFTLDVTNTGKIIWKYDLDGTETVQAANVLFDQTGGVTGERRVSYIALREPRIQSITQISNIATPGASPTIVNALDYTYVAGTSYIWFSTLPAGELIVEYKFSNAPDHSQTYYITAEAQRPADYYNTVIFLTSDDYREHLGYPTPDNDLAIMAELAFEEANVEQIAIVQVLDSDKDGTHSDADYNIAIQATREVKAFSDLCVIGNVASVGATVNELEIRNDPFEASETLGFFGYPALTPIGSPQLNEGTLLHFAGEVLQVPAASNSHGAHISIANTWAKRTITDRNGFQSEVTLDGSFIAGTVAAMLSALPRPFNTLLRAQVPGFSEIQEYKDSEIERLGSYGWVIIQADGDVHRVLDIVTHDNSAPNYRQVNAMTQKHYVNRVIREQLDAAIISIVPASQQDGEVLVGSALMDILRDLVARGDIGLYQTDDGSNRQIDRNTDIVIRRDTADPTKYYMSFQFWLRYHVARINGLYTVDTVKLFT